MVGGGQGRRLATGTVFWKKRSAEFFLNVHTALALLSLLLNTDSALQPGIVPSKEDCQHRSVRDGHGKPCILSPQIFLEKLSIFLQSI